MSDLPLSAEEFAHLLAPLLKQGERMAVAVSGGPDSMALVFCMAWLMTTSSSCQRRLASHLMSSEDQTNGTPAFAGVTVSSDVGHERGGELLALIVEHGLRDESAQEAAGVAERLRAMGIETEILPWTHDEVKSRVHVQARAARYGLLVAACKQRGITTLALAHHAGDQAETILMRFAKGSGIDGLAGMDAVTEVDGVRLVRPLLGVPKARLVATCEEHGVVYVTDPSNEAEKYARGRLRRVMPLLEAEGFTAERLLDLGDRAREAKEALSHYTRGFLKEAAHPMEGGAFQLDLAALRGLPRAVALRALTMLLEALHEEAYPPERKQLGPVLDWLLDQDEGEGRTLHGVIVQKGDLCDKAIFLREPAAITDVQPITAGQTVLWDGRWHVKLLAETSFLVGAAQSSSMDITAPLPNPPREGEGTSGFLAAKQGSDWRGGKYEEDSAQESGDIPSPSRGGLGRGDANDGSPNTEQKACLQIRALGLQTHEVLDRFAPRLRASIPQGRVRAGLPALWCGGELVAIPSFTEQDQGVATAMRRSVLWE